MANRKSESSEFELTTLEQHVLLAGLRHQPNAYGVVISDEIAKRTGRTPSTGAVYTALERLRARGFLTTRGGEPTAERGGRRKLFVEVTALGRRALDQSLKATDSLREGILVGAPA